MFLVRSGRSFRNRRLVEILPFCSNAPAGPDCVLALRPRSLRSHGPFRVGYVVWCHVSLALLCALALVPAVVHMRPAGAQRRRCGPRRRSTPAAPCWPPYRSGPSSRGARRLAASAVKRWHSGWSGSLGCEGRRQVVWPRDARKPWHRQNAIQVGVRLRGLDLRQHDHIPVRPRGEAELALGISR